MRCMLVKTRVDETAQHPVTAPWGNPEKSRETPSGFRVSMGLGLKAVLRLTFPPHRGAVIVAVVALSVLVCFSTP